MKLKRPEWVGPDVQLADLLMHQAGHAVVAWELGVRIIELHFSLKAWSGLMPFAGAITSCFDRALAADAAREAAEKDMLIFHAGRMAQLLFHYDSVHGYRNSSDLRGVIDACRRVEDATAVIDAWSEYIEERVRVMLSAPGTWSRVLALAPEIARRLSLTGHQIAAFLEHVDVAGAVAPHDTPWNRDRYAIGRGIDALGLSNRSRTCLERSQIGT
ncbi:MAG: hypothetical protein ABI779_05275, partial [Acidobacteriota bacterium]